MHGLMDSQNNAVSQMLDALPKHDIRRLGDFDAIISRVNCDLTDASLPPEMLEEIAFAHDAILTFHAASATVLPIRFGTAFSDEDKLRHFLANPVRVRDFRERLLSLHDQQEFSVKIFISGDPALPADTTTASKGRGFLQKRAMSRAISRKLTSHRAELVTAFVTALSRVASEICTQAARADRFFAITLLVHQSRVGQLRDCLASFSPEAKGLGLKLGITGPWPAYSFAEGITQEANQHA